MYKLYDVLLEKNIRCYLDRYLKNYTTLHIGGKAKLLVEPQSRQEIITVLKLCKKYHYQYYILGNGSNVLALDQGFDGVIIVLKSYHNIEIDNNCIKATCGVSLKEISDYCIAHSLTGFEFACGIPGSLGGAVFMNAGAYGGEMKDVVKEVIYLDSDFHIRTLKAKDMQFGYRQSYFSIHHGIVLEVVLELQNGNQKYIQERVNYLMALRQDKQPLDKYSAGSTFKRPKGSYASLLIKDLGLQGLKVGDAEVSKKHAGFLINRGLASSDDFLSLVHEVQKRVKQNTGYDLECEIKILR